MELIPAIDLMNGKCVRLTEGEKEKQKIYSSSPLDIALNFQNQGADRLHLVDLDGAFQGDMQNYQVICEIIENIDIPVQLGGGIRTAESVEKLIDLGVDQIILGTKAYSSPEFLQDMLSRYPSQITVGVDVKNDRVATEGWVEVSKTSTVEYLERLERVGVNRIILTDVGTDGRLEGPNLEMLARLLKFDNLEFILSGGISNSEDIKSLCDMSAPNLQGVILGTALYEQRLTLEEALKVVNSFGN